VSVSSSLSPFLVSESSAVRALSSSPLDGEGRRSAQTSHVPAAHIGHRQGSAPGIDRVDSGSGSLILPAPGNGRPGCPPGWSRA